MVVTVPDIESKLEKGAEIDVEIDNEKLILKRVEQI